MRTYWLRTKTASGKPLSKWHKVHAHSKREAVIKHAEGDYEGSRRKPKRVWGYRL